MSYEHHLRTALDAFSQARPDVSDRRLSIAAGLNAGWIADFRATGAATFSRSQMVLTAMRQLCPRGPEGEALRRVLAQIDPAATPDAEPAATSRAACGDAAVASGAPCGGTLA